ncbi:MAG: oxygen-independent coproporphyrinogen III oxidase [Gemmatimonadales bacterium]|nr:MAG: oxygen-independent coproporphyrinogen III oxidase [Gemmatimonadales bacterium]
MIDLAAHPVAPPPPGLDLTPERVAHYNRPGPRYTSYPPIPFWSEKIGEEDYREALGRARAAPDEAVALYVHLPFCAERCAYCGCNATVTNRASVVDDYLDRVEAEIGAVVETLGRGRRALELHLGGGTPNFLTQGQMERLLGCLEGAFSLGPEVDRSLEIDPRIATPAQVRAFRTLGFTRISLGVQDMDPRVQEAIGRIQPESLTREIFQAAREAGFPSVNLDLVYGLPYQTPEVFQRTLDAVVELRPDRLSCFSYAHLPHLRPNQKQVDARGLPASAWEKFSLFRQAVEQFTSAGWSWIGMDHFALESDSLARALRERRLHRNFMGYVEQAAPHLVAFGCSAIGEVGGMQVQSNPKLGAWQRTLDAGRLPVIRGHHLTPEDLRRREAIHHLLSNLELPLSLLDAVPGAGGSDLPALDRARKALEAHAEHGLLRRHDNRFEVTELGRWFVRNLCMELDAYLPVTLPAGSSGGPRFSMTV